MRKKYRQSEQAGGDGEISQEYDSARNKISEKIDENKLVNPFELYRPKQYQSNSRNQKNNKMAKAEKSHSKGFNSERSGGSGFSGTQNLTQRE